jgi:drug/metabolite transporter (DMT)-like permease
VSARGEPGGNAVLYLAPTLIWGSTWYVITFQLGVVPPEVSVAYRFALAALLLAGGCAATGRSLAFSAREHASIAAQGICMFGLAYVAIYRAERHVASGLLAVLYTTIVFMNVAGARVFFGTPMTARALVGAALGVAGVALLFLPEITAASYGGHAGTGIALGLLAVACSSAGSLFAVRNQNAGVPTMQGTAWGMAYGAVVAALAAAAGGAEWTFDFRPAYVASLAYLAVFGSIVAFVTYLTLIKRIGAGPASYTGVITPIVAMLVTTLFEGYRWTGVAIAGVALAAAGNVLVLTARDRR